MTQVTLRDDQLPALAKLIAVESAQHSCRFAEDEAKAMHRFAQEMSNGGWDKFRSVLDFGAMLIEARKAGVVALVGLCVAALVGAVWVGFKFKMRGC